MSGPAMPVDMVRTDPNLPVDDEWAKTVCKIGQGHACCRYLTMAGAKGWSCEKLGSLAELLDFRVSEHTIVSRGINCSGRLCK